MVSIRSLETTISTLKDQLVHAKRFYRFNQVPHLEQELQHAKDRLQELQPTT